MGMRSRFLRFGIAIVVMELFPACNGGHVYVRSLSPVDIAQDCKSSVEMSDKFYCTGLDKWGSGCTGADGAVVVKDTIRHLSGVAPLVGFQHKYDPGSGSLPCWDAGRWNSRAYVNFNILQADPKIESLAIATLSWEPWSKRSEEGTASNTPGNLPPHCFKALYEATLTWTMYGGKRPTGNLIEDGLDQSGATKITVTPVVQKWVASSGVIFPGFFFTAADEGLSAKENKACWSTLNSLKLNLTYKAK